MRWIIRTVAAVVILLFSTGAQAHDFYYHPPQDFYFQPYAGVGFGVFNLSTNNNSDNVFGAYGVLGADFHEYLGAEFRIGSAADGSAAGFSELSLDWFTSFLAKFQFPATEYLRIYGLLGATVLHSNLTQTTGVQLGKTNADFTFGGGLDYHILDNLMIAGEWTQYANKYDATTKKGLDVWGATALIKYEF